MKNYHVKPGLYFSFKLGLGSYSVYIAETVHKEIGALFQSGSFFCLWLLVVSTNLLYDLVWKTVFMTGLIFLPST